MSAYERRKGVTYERELAKRLRKIFPESRRGLQFQNRFAPNQPDVIAGPFVVECKNVKSLNVVDALDQATHAATPGQYPIVAAKLRGTEFVVMRTDDWEEIICEWWRCKHA